MDRPKPPPPHNRPLSEGGGVEMPESSQGGGEIGGCARVQSKQSDPYNFVFLLLTGLYPEGDEQQLPISR